MYASWYQTRFTAANSDEIGSQLSRWHWWKPSHSVEVGSSMEIMPTSDKGLSQCVFEVCKCGCVLSAGSWSILRRGVRLKSGGNWAGKSVGEVVCTNYIPIQNVKIWRWVKRDLKLVNRPCTECWSKSIRFASNPATTYEQCHTVESIFRVYWGL